MAKQEIIRSSGIITSLRYPTRVYREAGCTKTNLRCLRNGNVWQPFLQDISQLKLHLEACVLHVSRPPEAHVHDPESLLEPIPRVLRASALPSFLLYNSSLEAG